MEWRTFESFPANHACPVCGTDDDKKCVLVAKANTHRDWICEAIPVHVDCLRPEQMVYDPSIGMIFIMGRMGL